MTAKLSSDEPMRRALLDVVQSLRSLAARTKGIAELGAQSGRPMDPLVQRSRQLLQALEDASEIMSLFEGPQSGEDNLLKIEREDVEGGAQKVVVRCVTSMLDSENPVPISVETPSLTRDRIDLRGLSWSIGIPELLSFLETINKTGTISVSTFDESFTIVLKEGQVVHASSSSSPHGLRLGDILVNQGATSHLQLREFLRDHDSSSAPIGDVLVGEGLVTREQLASAIEFQVQQLFNRLFNATDATFSFYDGRTSTNEHQVHMNLTRLLLESSIVQEVTGERKPA